MTTSQLLKRPVYRSVLFFFFVYSGTVSASENEKKQQVSPHESLSDSLGIVKHVSTSPASLSANPSIMVPDGFVMRVIKKGDSRSKFCKADSSSEALFMKVNRLDKRHFPVGKQVLVPVDISKALRYVPVPKTLTDSRGEREIRIFLTSQYFGAYGHDTLFFWGPVSSGMAKKSTPAGKFFVNYKQRAKRSIKYDNAPMPFSINYNNGYFMHQQSLPGYPASHGCIRLLVDDAEKLFFWVRLHDPVTVDKELK